MNSFTWIFLLIMHLVLVTPRSLETNAADQDTAQEPPPPPNHRSSNYKGPSKTDSQKVISVRITSSIAIGRGKLKSSQLTSTSPETKTEFSSRPFTPTTETLFVNEEDYKTQMPINLEGANIEYLKQLNAKKDDRDINMDQVHPYQLRQQRNNESDFSNENNEEYVTKIDHEYTNMDNIPESDNEPSSSQEVNSYKGAGDLESDLIHEALKYSEERSNSTDTDDLLARAESQKAADITSPTTDIDETYFNRNVTDNDDSIAEPSTKAEIEMSDKNNENYENVENVPLARSVLQSPSSKNFIQGFTNKPPSEREPNPRLTTVSFNIVHDAPNPRTNGFSDPMKSYGDSNRAFDRQQKFYDPPKVYSQPAQIYSEPSKFYSEPAKIYSEPAKIYSEPAKVYSEPAKIYSEPAKFYSEPASLHLTPNDSPNYSSWQQRSRAPSTTHSVNTTPLNTMRAPAPSVTPRIPEHLPEKNYEIDEKVSVLTDGRSHGVQESTTEKCKQDSCKVGYVVKGRQFNKYRVEERTSDGFIVGEYGVVRNEDGALRGVRYTADGEASPRLIHDALMKFLQL